MEWGIGIGDAYDWIPSELRSEETLLPEQVDHSKESVREKALVEQLFMDALIELQYTFQSLSKAKKREEILSWFYGDAAAITFEFACAILKLNHDKWKSMIPVMCKMWEQSGGRHPNMRQFRPLRGLKTSQLGDAFLSKKNYHKFKGGKYATGPRSRGNESL